MTGTTRRYYLIGLLAITCYAIGDAVGSHPLRTEVTIVVTLAIGALVSVAASWIAKAGT